MRGTDRGSLVPPDFRTPTWQGLVRKIAEVVPERQLVAFRLGPEEFGLDVLSVHEVLRYQPVMRVPKAPAFVEGVIEVRGALIPVIDMRRRFELNAPYDAETRVVVVAFDGERLGLVVDAVTSVLRVPESAIAAPPRYFKGIAAEYIRGIARADDRLMILLELDRVLSSDERIALREADLAPQEDTPESAADPTRG